ncbi:hypothetical protein [Blastococcus mobilis]|uniref:Uncharacterized protein n=1 Tax=Blastococcus mobilis TaxID=1938746 RepID=A0A238VY75_9ACTN|nr:hypothetical protein [Blastococcus mobilis]SNR38813.1 hypothetical protein SAMN06272737_105125 [Blastococcus mobilis]
MPPVNRSPRSPRPAYGRPAARAAGAREPNLMPKVKLMAAALEDPDGRFARREQMPTAPRMDVPAGTERRIRFAVPEWEQVETENAVGNWHHHRRSSFRRNWRYAARDAALAAVEDLAGIRGCRVEVTVALPWRGRSKSIDPANLRATTKPILDGISDAQAVWPDDNWTWVTEREPLPWQGDDVVVRLVVVDPAAPGEWNPAE